MRLWQFFAGLGTLIIVIDLIVNYDPTTMFLWIFAGGLFVIAAYLFGKTW